MSSTPPESDSDPSTPMLEAKVPPAPPPEVGSQKAPTFQGAESWSVDIGEVFDLGPGGRYTVKERLGQGGMGEVYRAEYVSPASQDVVQVVALKVLRPGAIPDQQRAFIDEVRLLSSLRHNNIARCHCFFADKDKGRQVLVMDYVDGCSLHTILKEVRRTGRTLSEATSLELLAQVARALHHAEVARDDSGRPLNIVHRDVSPSNIMVNRAGFAVLMDFGVAKNNLKGRRQTRPGDKLRIWGKPPYLSPEQVLNLPLDGRADLFSLCCILVEMLTGEPPFSRSDLALKFIPKVTPALVDRITRGLSRKVRAICQKGLARDPSGRFDDGEEMALAMLANLPDRGPAAILKELSELEKAPDAPRTARERMNAAVRRLRRLQWKGRALAFGGVLAVAILTVFLLWNGSYSKPPAVKAEEGKPTVNQMKPESAPPAIAEAAPAEPTGSPVLKKPTNCRFVLVLTAGVMACAHTIHTGAKAGDCTTDRQLKHEFDGKPIPDVMHVTLSPSNREGKCEGEECTPERIECDEPCPVYDNGEIIMRLSGTMVPSTLPGGVENLWFGPEDGFPDVRSLDKPALLIGRTKTFDATGKYDTGWGHGPRELSGRMTALVTKIQTWDGKEVPVCGVLYGDDGKEGVPIFAAPYFDKPTGGAWGRAYIKFFWPDGK